MTIYRTDNIGVWCSCEKCGAVDDLADNELGDGEDIVYPVIEETFIMPEGESEVTYQISSKILGNIDNIVKTGLDLDYKNVDAAMSAAYKRT